jgi:cathepsin D
MVPIWFAVDFVTGISEFFLPGPGCTGCTNHTGFDPTLSTTSKNTGKQFTWLSVDGSTVNGTLYSDNVKIAGLTAYNQIFGLAKNVSASYWLYLFPTDGLLGLGFPETSQFNVTPVFQNLIKQDAVKEPRFGLKLAETGSELTLGGVNHELYKGPFHYSPLTTKVCLLVHDVLNIFFTPIVGLMAN